DEHGRRTHERVSLAAPGNVNVKTAPPTGSGAPSRGPPLSAARSGAVPAGTRREGAIYSTFRASRAGTMLMASIDGQGGARQGFSANSEAVRGRKAVPANASKSIFLPKSQEKQSDAPGQESRENRRSKQYEDQWRPSICRRERLSGLGWL